MTAVIVYCKFPQLPRKFMLYELPLSQPTQNVFIQTDYCKRNVDWGVVQSSDSGLLLSPILAEYRSFKSLNITFHFLSLCFASINSPWHSLTNSTHQLTKLENGYTKRTSTCCWYMFTDALYSTRKHVHTHTRQGNGPLLTGPNSPRNIGRHATTYLQSVHNKLGEVPHLQLCHSRQNVSLFPSESWPLSIS